MVRHYALCVGLTHVDPTTPEYDGWDGAAGCTGCKKDVEHVRTYLRGLGYVVTAKTNQEATKSGVLAGLSWLANRALANDRVVIYYSGHGGQVPDMDGDEADDDLDETLVLYDGQMLDDEIHDSLVRFQQGVRVIMVSDSCHSASNYRAGPDELVPRFSMERASRGVGAGMIHLAGCRDSGVSMGYDQGGAFTLAMMGVLKDPSFTGTLKDLHGRICQRIDRTQEPQYAEYGIVSPEFRAARAFH